MRFGKTLKVETVMPNRLKIELDLGTKDVMASSPMKGGIDSQWLSGATAAGLRANLEVRLSPSSTNFTRVKDYTFEADRMSDGKRANTGVCTVQLKVPGA